MSWFGIIAIVVAVVVAAGAILYLIEYGKGMSR